MTYRKFARLIGGHEIVHVLDPGHRREHFYHRVPGISIESYQQSATKKMCWGARSLDTMAEQLLPSWGSQISMSQRRRIPILQELQLFWKTRLPDRLRLVAEQIRQVLDEGELEDWEPRSVSARLPSAIPNQHALLSERTEENAPA
jgi:hypothetical protein